MTLGVRLDAVNRPSKLQKRIVTADVADKRRLEPIQFNFYLRLSATSVDFLVLEGLTAYGVTDGWCSSAVGGKTLLGKPAVAPEIGFETGGPVLARIATRN